MFISVCEVELVDEDFEAPIQNSVVSVSLDGTVVSKVLDANFSLVVVAWGDWVVLLPQH